MILPSYDWHYTVCAIDLKAEIFGEIKNICFFVCPSIFHFMRPMNFFKAFTAALFIQCSAIAQDTTLINAFSNSYKLEKESDFSGAIIAMNDVYDSASYEMNLRMGWLHYSAGFYDRSIHFYNKAVSIIPSSEEARLGLVMPATALVKTELLIDNYKKILEVNPANTIVSYSLGLIYYNLAKYSDAAAQFNRVLEFYPFNYNAILMSGWCNYRLGNRKEAKEMFIKAMLLSPNDKSAKDGIALLGASYKGFQNLINAFSKSYSAFYNADYGRAMRELQLVYDKNSYDVNIRLAYLNYLGGLNQEAMNFYSIAEALNKKALEPLFGYINPAAAFGQADEVTKHYSRILEIDPQNTEANFAMGKISFQNKDYASAKNYFAKVLKLYPFSYNSLIMLARCYVQLNEKAEAKNTFGKILLLSPADKEAMEALKAKK
jgi:tetratricopeptide (TPR) repeat protein